MIKVDVRGNMNGIIADLERRQRDVLDRALPATLNKLIDQTKTATARAIRDAGYQIKLADIKAGLIPFYAGNGGLTVKLTAKGRPIPLMSYGGREVAGKGVSVNVLNGRKLITNAFVGVSSGGGQRVYIRDGAKHRKSLYGPGIPDAFNNAKVQARMQEFTAEKFPVILLQQIKRFAK